MATESKKGLTCKVAACSCANKGQDEIYGKGMRLFNQRGKGKSTDNRHLYRCTVCGTEKALGR